jgi:GcrA cell cycle regulator
MSQYGSPDWTADEIALLERLWAEGHSMGQIGRITGRGKNAVVGKVHRLGLPGRPSPIQQAGYVPARRAKRARLPGSVTLAPLASVVAAAKPPRKLPLPDTATVNITDGASSVTIHGRLKGFGP